MLAELFEKSAIKEVSLIETSETLIRAVSAKQLSPFKSYVTRNNQLGKIFQFIFCEGQNEKQENRIFFNLPAR